MVRGLRKFVKLIVWLVLLLAVGFVLLNMKYPLGYVKVIDKYAEEYQVDKYLIYSLINTESGFHKDAKSSKGANGLMQLMPPTTEEICSDLGENLNGIDTSDPETNIKYGIYYFKQLLNKYDNQVDIALAAYNAGMGNVNDWIADNGTSNFAERIPIKETKEYVKRVNTGRDMYKLMYNDLKFKSLFDEEHKIKIMYDFKNALKGIKNKVSSLL